MLTKALAAALFASILLFPIIFSSRASAEACQLVEVASVDIQEGTDQAWLLPARINGTPVLMQFSLSEPETVIFKPTDEKLHLARSRLSDSEELNFHGRTAMESASISELAVGSGALRGIKRPLAPVLEGMDTRAAGIIGLDVLHNFDLEIDLKNKSLKLFSPHECPGKVVYWSKEYAQLPFDITETYEVVLPMQLDGKSVTAAFDFQHRHTLLGFSPAWRLFTLTRASSGMAQTDEVLDEWETGLNRNSDPLYVYPFRELSAGELTIQNPKIYLYGNSQDVQCNGKPQVTQSLDVGRGWEPPALAYTCFGATDVTLGTNFLSALHLYFSFADKTLYFTAA